MRIVFAVNGTPNVPIEQTALLASARYRGLIPAREMNRRQIDAQVMPVLDLFRPDFDPATVDLLVLHQPKHDIMLVENIIGLLVGRVETIRRNGGAVVIDVSDFKLGETLHNRISNTIGDRRATMYQMILNELFARCSAVTAPTENLAELMRQNLRQPVPVVLIDDVVEVTRGEPRFAPGETLNLLWFGRLGSHINAVRDFVRNDLPQIARLRPARLTFLSEPVQVQNPVEYFGATLEELGIRFELWSVPALDRALAQCDMVVLPVDTEGPAAKGKSNNRVLQALYAGRYAVAHPLDSFRQLGDFIGLDRSLPAAVAAALADPAAATERVRHGQRHVEELYSPAAIADKWIALCRRLAAEPARTG
jgi:glycosyltransferase involved in cell wall biosynthesis